jgi:hypothetical protein
MKRTVIISEQQFTKLIKKILKEEDNMDNNTFPKNHKELINMMPDSLKNLFYTQWQAKQNPKWHIEGNTLKHIIIVLKRAFEHYPNNPDIILAALFHDLGKLDTYAINPKTGQPTAYGHEVKSGEYLEKYKDWVNSFEGINFDKIKYLVLNHMVIKPSTWDNMRQQKKDPIEQNPSFEDLKNFTNHLDGGGY